MARRKTAKPDDTAPLEAAAAEAPAPLALAAKADTGTATAGAPDATAPDAPTGDGATPEPATAEPAPGRDEGITGAGSGREVLLFLNRFTRFPKIRVSRAATIALAAGLGAVVGSLAASGIAGMASRGGGDPDPVMALQESIRTLAVEVRAMKTSVGASTGDAAGGLAALGQRLDRGEKAQAAIMGEIGKLASSLATPPVSTETTGSVAPADKPDPAHGWVLWRVRDGRALVHGNGSYYEVVQGSRIPGLGLVQKITRQDGRWVVTTQNGIITSPGG